MHEGDSHARDAESYAPSIRAVLRDGAALPFPEQGGPGGASGADRAENRSEPEIYRFLWPDADHG